VLLSIFLFDLSIPQMHPDFEINWHFWLLSIGVSDKIMGEKSKKKIFFRAYLDHPTISCLLLKAVLPRVNSLKSHWLPRAIEFGQFLFGELPKFVNGSAESFSHNRANECSSVHSSVPTVRMPCVCVIYSHKSYIWTQRIAISHWFNCLCFDKCCCWLNGLVDQRQQTSEQNKTSLWTMMTGHTNFPIYLRVCESAFAMSTFGGECRLFPGK